MDGPEEVTITSVSNWAQTAGSEDVTPSEQVLVVAPVPVSDEQAVVPDEPLSPVALDDTASGEPRSPLRAVQHPVFLASLDYTAEPLFALADTPATTRAAPRSRARRQPRRSPARAPDLQEALFDLPPPAPARPAGQRNTTARRK